MNHFHYRGEVLVAAERNGLDPDLVEAVIWQESAGDPHARRAEPGFWKRYMAHREEYAGEHWLRWSSSLGLMQLMPTSAIETRLVARKDAGMPEILFSPSLNIEIGCAMLKRLLEWADGDLSKALAAYNGGRGNWRGEHPQRYAKQVLEKYAQVKARRAA
jgi:soluble lytic murein transglycosylase-like protein